MQMNCNAYVSHSKKLVVFWSPKCACTAVVDWFFTIENLSSTFLDKRGWLAANGFLYTYEQARHLVEDLGYDSIQFTRNPYSRAASAFLSKFCIYRQKGLSRLEDLELFARRFVAGFNERRNLDPTKYFGMSFLDYLNHVKYLIEKQNIINPHWDTQLPRNLEFRIKPCFFIRQERFDQDLKHVNEKLGIKNYIPGKSNATAWPDDFEPVDTDEASTNTLDILKEKKRIRESNLLNIASRRIIEDIYAEDFSFFGYSRCSRDGKTSSLLQSLINFCGR